MHYYIVILFLLIGFHFLCDFAFQTQFIADGKNPNKPIPRITWQWVMIAHVFIHALFVYFATQVFVLALFELAFHLIVDISKCRGWFGEGNRAFNIDQSLHVFSKFIWIFILFLLHVQQ